MDPSGPSRAARTRTPFTQTHFLMRLLTDQTPFDLPDHVRRAAELALERKAQDVVVLDLRGISTATDFFVLATGTSDIQVKAIADHVVEEGKKEGVRPEHVEGIQGGRWVLLDYVDCVVHVFHPETRDFYQLESLWGDAPSLTATD